MLRSSTLNNQMIETVSQIANKMGIKTEAESDKENLFKLVEKDQGDNYSNFVETFKNDVIFNNNDGSIHVGQTFLNLVKQSLCNIFKNADGDIVVGSALNVLNGILVTDKSVNVDIASGKFKITFAPFIYVNSDKAFESVMSYKIETTGYNLMGVLAFIYADSNKNYYNYPYKVKYDDATGEFWIEFVGETPTDTYRVLKYEIKSKLNLDETKFPFNPDDFDSEGTKPDENPDGSIDLGKPEIDKLKPVILDIPDIQVYQNEKTPIQFYAYDEDGYITEFYFSLTAGQTEARFYPKYLSNSCYTNTFLFDSLGEYDCTIKVVDNDGLYARSNVFKIKVLPPLIDTSPKPIVPDVSYSDSVILYDKNSTEFTSNGIGILKDCISCIATHESGGIYEIELEYPIGTRFDSYLLDTEYIIKCNVDNKSNSQLFRIYDSEYVMELNRIFVRARHITYDLEGSFIEGLSLISTTCQSATQTLISNSVGSVINKFNVISNINKIKSFNISMCNVLESLIGVEGSIIDTYGNKNTKIVRDNFTFNITNSEVDTGVLIAYKKNLLGFKRKINTENIVTKIYPYKILDYGKVLVLSEKFIVADNAGTYANEKIKAIEMTDDSIVSQSTLREYAKSYFSDNQVNIPIVNYEVDFVLLYNSSNYANFRSLEKVSVNDVVTVQDSRINANIKASVIKTEYDHISKRFKKIELGNFRNEYRTSKKNEYSNLRRLIQNIK